MSSMVYYQIYVTVRVRVKVKHLVVVFNTRGLGMLYSNVLTKIVCLCVCVCVESHTCV